ncbi:FtsX-like permease family protein [Balneolaceae bacterium YR4-1]|uniref:FtsX-like permease family protein n=1 Tax=Halalkalibaculum roseum TaxID=2709311 RepID=A0A6M1SXB0_9BACT|nr:ABC transporter permease [Halalkalibaculum roseum]NGP77680.1 FtsX-like permease family protein [Halalkalibaculum roseum]
MIKNYIKIALRNLRKYKGYSLINILGLAVGIAVCMLIFRYVSYELSYDQYHSKSDRIYRVTMDHPQAHIALTPSMILPTLENLYPEVETGVRIYDVGRFQPLVIRNDNKVFEERKFAYADSTLFRVFDFELLSGNSNTALAKPNTIVISREMALKYFDNHNAIGKSLEVNNRVFEVTGVMENIPGNSHFRYDFFASLITRSGWSELSDDTWRSANFYTYLVLDNQGGASGLKQKVDAFITENFPENEFAASLDLLFQPLTDIHLYSDVEGEIAPQSDIRYVLAATAIAIIILIIACINYMNLATARSARRSREVGIRKVLGSEKRQLIGQFYGESAFLTMLAIALSLLMMELFLPWFNSLTGQSIYIDYASYEFWLVLAATGLLVTLVAGSYPALMLSSFNPSEVLKGKKISSGSSKLRKFLVVFQFAASIFMIICTLVIYRQIDFIQEKELGYKQDNVLVLTAYSDVENRFNTLQNELMQVSEIKGVAMSSETPTSIRAGYGPDIEGVEEGPNFIINALRVTPGFTDALNIELVEGRAFTEGDFTRANLQEDREYAMLVNEATARHFGMDPEELVGKRASIGGGSGNIVGVVRDFHFSSLHRPIEPLFIFPRGSFNKLLISFRSADVRNVLEDTEAVWSNLFPQYPFTYEFLDQEYNALYQQETRAGYIFNSFAILAIFVACLGLVGLASYLVEERNREIGIRKVLGATSAQVMALLSKDFVILVLAGFLISVPLAWYAMGEWLQNFAYRIDIGWYVFLMAGGITLLIAVATVSYQALRAATLDPVDSLRSE